MSKIRYKLALATAIGGVLMLSGLTTVTAADLTPLVCLHDISVHRPGVTTQAVKEIPVHEFPPWFGDTQEAFTRPPTQATLASRLLVGQTI